MNAKGWHARGYLPHYDGPGVVQHVIFHLHDAAPRDAPIGDDVCTLGAQCLIMCMS